MPFQEGQSGNPKGRPKGAVNKTTIPAEQLLDGEAQEITRKVIELAKQGNLAALELCLERVLPPRQDRTVVLKLPEVNVASDVPRALNAILTGVGKGAITPREAEILANVVAATYQMRPHQPLEFRPTELTTEDLMDPQVYKAYQALRAEVRRSRQERKTGP
jgi:hypothetical protein